MSPNTLSPDSRTLTPLPLVLKHGLPAVAVFGSLSFLFSTALFLFLTYRLISWRQKSGSQASTNQFFVLIYNLVLADIQQSIAFLLNAVSLHRDSIHVGTSECWAQGWFVSTGDLASSVFILAIAAHTFMGVVKGYKLPSYLFYTIIGCLWTFVYVLAIIGAVMHPKDIYVRAGAWCWINTAYQNERLYLHYLWIFVCMFSTILMYTFIYVTLRRRSSQSQIKLNTPSPTNPLPRPSIPHGATPLMLLYPAIYTICTIPLAAGRIASMAGRVISLEYFCVAGAMIACNGWLDVLLYSLTRRSIVFSDAPPGDDAGLDTFWVLGPRRSGLGNVTVIEGGGNGGSHLQGKPSKGRVSSSASTENLYAVSKNTGSGAFAGIKTETTVNVQREVVVDMDDAFEMGVRGKGGMSRERLDKQASWETRSARSARSGRSFDI